MLISLKVHSPQKYGKNIITGTRYKTSMLVLSRIILISIKLIETFIPLLTFFVIKPLGKSAINNNI